MAEYSRFFGSEGLIEYSQPQFAEVLEKIFSNGVFADIDNKLEVVENDPASMSVIIKSGEAWINGFWYQNTANLVKSLGAADPTNNRIDRIILRLDTTTDLKISVEVLEGTPSGSPSAPILTQTAETYEISLAQVLVGAAVTSIVNANITDERERVTSQNVLLADNAVTTAKIADGAVATAKIADGAVTDIKIADSAVATAKIADSAVATAKIQDGAVATAKIADSAVATAKIADSAVTDIKITDSKIITTTIASSATPTPARASVKTLYIITALAEAATFGAPTGSPIQGDMILIRIKDNGTACTIGHNAIYRAIGVTLLTTTVINKTHYELFIYNSTDTKWDCLAVGSED